MSAHESPKKVQVSYFDTDDVGHLCVSAARPLPVTDAAAVAAINPSPAAAVAAVVGVTNVSQVLVAADANRQSLFVYNPSAVIVYVSNVNPAVIATSIPIPAGGYITRDPGSGSKLAWWVIAAVVGPNNINVESVA